MHTIPHHIHSYTIHLARFQFLNPRQGESNPGVGGTQSNQIVTIRVTTMPNRHNHSVGNSLHSSRWRCRASPSKAKWWASRSGGGSGEMAMLMAKAFSCLTGIKNVAEKHRETERNPTKVLRARGWRHHLAISTIRPLKWLAGRMAEELGIFATRLAYVHTNLQRCGNCAGSGRSMHI